MGNCIQKPKRKKINNPNEVVNIPPMSPLMDIPTDPSKDPFGKYLWINVHTCSINFQNDHELLRVSFYFLLFPSDLKIQQFDIFFISIHLILLLLLLVFFLFLN